MNASEHILLASHGTVGARAAEKEVLACANKISKITHLIVIPELWRHMLGDDWLNNSITRIRFENYLESQLAHEINQTISRVERLFNNIAEYRYKIQFGAPDECLINTCLNNTFTAVIMGSRRPKKIAGLNSKMLTAKLHKKLDIPLTTIPHPNA